MFWVTKLTAATSSQFGTVQLQQDGPRQQRQKEDREFEIDVPDDGVLDGGEHRLQVRVAGLPGVPRTSYTHSRALAPAAAAAAAAGPQTPARRRRRPIPIP